MDLYSLLDSTLSEIVNKWDIPGLAVGIVNADQPGYTRCFGVQSLDTCVPADRDTVFCVSSVSKCFVAAAAVQRTERAGQAGHGSLSMRNIMLRTAVFSSFFIGSVTRRAPRTGVYRGQRYSPINNTAWGNRVSG